MGAAAGPLYAQYVDNCFTIIDQHNHAAGSGVAINPSGININADLPFNSNNATLLRTTRYAVQTSPITSAAPDQGALYVATVSANTELFYNDSSGNQVQITSGGVINATGSNISNGTARAQIDGANELSVTFISSGSPANINAGSYLMGSAANGANTLTLQPPTLGANETLTFPTLPGALSIVQMTTLGVLEANLVVDNSTLTNSGTVLSVANQGITAAQIANNTITAGQIANATITGTQLEDSINLPSKPTFGPSSFGVLGSNGSSNNFQIVAGIVNASGTVLNGNGVIALSWSGAVLTITINANATLGTVMGVVNNLTTNALAFQSASTRTTVSFNTGSGHADTLAFIIFAFAP